MRRRDILSVLSLLPLAALPVAPALAFTENDVSAAQSAIMSAGSRASIVRRLAEVPSVGVVDLRFRGRPRFRSNLPDVADFRISAEKNSAGIARLRRALTANPVTREAMARHGIRVSRVVGVMIGSNGALRFYVL